MNEPTLDMLAGRVERLERENRRLKTLGGVMVLGVAAVVLMGQAAPAGRTVEAEAFHLRNKSGALVGALQVTSEGTPELVFWRKIDGSPDIGVMLRTQSDGESALTLYGKHDTYVSLMADRDQAGVGATRRGKVRVLVGTMPRDRQGSNSNGLFLVDKDTRLLVSLADHTDRTDGNASLEFFDPLIAKRKALINEQGIALYEKDVPRAGLVVNPADGVAALGLHDKAGKPRAGWLVKPDGGTTTLSP